MDIFDPYQLIPLATINQRKIIALPGINAAWVGMIGFELVGKHALINAIQQQASELGLEEADPAGLPFQLNQCLESTHDRVRSTAETIAQRYGQGLGALIASIMRAPEGLSSPMLPWEAGYLKHWREEVKQIFLGGGLANGRLGHILAPAASTVLEQSGISGIQILVSAYPSYLTLIGAARRVQPDCQGAVVVFDFGHTWVKRGIAAYQDENTLVGLQVLSPISTEKLNLLPDKPYELAEGMISIISHTYQEASQRAAVSPVIVCCQASYVRDGQPIQLNRGSYAQLVDISPDFSGWLSKKVGERLDKIVSIKLAHDCEAAAWAYAGQPQTATIMLGTASGVGFAPPGSQFRPISAHFKVNAG